MSLVRAVGRNTLIQFGGKILGTGLGLLTVGLMQRYLAPAGFGAYTTAVTYLGFFSVIADLGLYLMLIRELTKPGADESRVVGNLLGLRWVSAIIILGAGTLLVAVTPYTGDVKSAVSIGVWSYIAIAATQLLVGVFQTKLLMGRVAAAELIGRVVLLAGTAAVIKTGGTLDQIMLAVVSGSLVNFMLIWLATSRLVKLRPRFEFDFWRRILRDTWPVALSIVLNLVYFQIGTIFLSLMSTQYDVGLYGAAYKILEILNTFPIMFVGLLLPALGAAFNVGDREKFKQIYQKGFDLLLMAALPLLVGGWIMAEPTLVAIGADQYGPAAPILRLLLIAVTALFLNSLSGHAVTMINRQRQMVWGYLSVAVIGVVLYIVLIDKFNTIGAAIGAIISQSLMVIIGYGVVLKVMRFKLNTRALGKILLATAVMGAATWLLRAHNFWLTAAVSAAVYGASLFVTRALTVAQLKEIFSQPAVTTTSLPDQ